ncbi:hypothetical protein ABBQ32_008754 [Trebouxia sp. C0010 RCD-2024]
MQSVQTQAALAEQPAALEQSAAPQQPAALQQPTSLQVELASEEGRKGLSALWFDESGCSDVTFRDQRAAASHTATRGTGL